jgi:hypothetical protein
MATTAKPRPITIKLTEDQKKQLQKFWKDHGRLGRAEVLVEVVNDRVSPTSIQVEAPQ